jgi:hypothetical protein
MFTFAQMPAATGDMILTVFLGAAAILVAAKNVRDLFWPPRPPTPRTEEYVTKGELTSALADIRAEVMGLKADVLARVDRVDVYQRDAAHRSAQGQQNLMLKIERLLALEESRARTPRTSPRPDDAPPEEAT